MLDGLTFLPIIIKFYDGIKYLKMVCTKEPTKVLHYFDTSMVYIEDQKTI